MIGNKVPYQYGNLRKLCAGDVKLFEYIEVGHVNDHMLNIIPAANRTLEFHSHPDSEEMFYVLEGEMDIEFRGEMKHLAQDDFIIIPRGTEHRPVCHGLVKALLIEKTGTLDASNTGGTYKK